MRNRCVEKRCFCAVQLMVGWWVNLRVTVAQIGAQKRPLPDDWTVGAFASGKRFGAGNAGRGIMRRAAAGFAAFAAKEHKLGRLKRLAFAFLRGATMRAMWRAVRISEGDRRAHKRVPGAAEAAMQEALRIGAKA